MSFDGVTLSLRVASRGNILKFQDRSGQFVASLETEMFRAQRYQRPLSLISVNVLGADRTSREGVASRQLYFDNKLRRFASDLLRMPDFWGRVDRETFAFVLPETPLDGARKTVERLAQAAPFAQLVSPGAWRILIGAAECPASIDSVELFVAEAKANTIWRNDDA